MHLVADGNSVAHFVGEVLAVPMEDIERRLAHQRLCSSDNQGRTEGLELMIVFVVDPELVSCKQLG